MAIVEVATGSARPRGTLIVFARRPRPGVKRRLARVLGGAHAARVYASLLARTLAVAGRAGFRRRWLMPASPADAGVFRACWQRAGWQVRAQCAGTLGRRMERALAHALGRGEPAILIGSDVADFTTRDLERARRALDAGADVVIGPAADGGYWLIGLKQPRWELFRGMPWGGTEVCALTLERLIALRLVCVRLPVRHDVDRARDLAFLPAPCRARRR